MQQVGQLPQEGPKEPEGERDPRRLVAKLDYEIGLSLRVIGSKVGVSDTTIRIWAREEGWERSSPASRGGRPKQPKPTSTRASVVAARIAERVEVASQNVLRAAPCEPETANLGPAETANCEGETANLETANCVIEQDQPLDQRFRARVRELLTNPTRDDAVDVAARAVVQVVKEHRVSLTKSQMLCERLLGQLDIASVTRDELEEFIHQNTEPGKYRSMLMKMVQLPAHAAVLRDLATAQVKLVTMERQAFGLGASDDPTPAPPPEAVPVKTSEFDRIRERVQLRIAGGTQA